LRRLIGSLHSACKHDASIIGVGGGSLPNTGSSELRGRPARRSVAGAPGTIREALAPLRTKGPVRKVTTSFGSRRGGMRALGGMRNSTRTGNSDATHLCEPAITISTRTSVIPLHTHQPAQHQRDPSIRPPHVPTCRSQAMAGWQGARSNNPSLSVTVVGDRAAFPKP
jgi:hypothetical protein